ncbi:MAG: zf-HC2 domain-containing protein [Candidatus Krumholzibacteriia bacterium]
MNRCVDTRIGVKVLSYDLLEGDEKDEVDRHLEECKACRDLVEQTFGDEGALNELEWRAFRLSQRQNIEFHALIARRLRDLWLPFVVVVAGAIVLMLYLARRGPDPERVGVLRLATSREATLDSLSAAPVPRISPAPTSVIVRPDRDAIVFVYEAGDGYLRRLIPGLDRAPPELSPGRAHELVLPPLESDAARILLILAPSGAPGTLDAWDRAVYARLGGEPEEGKQSRGWPQGVVPTLRWIH